MAERLMAGEGNVPTEGVSPTGPVKPGEVAVNASLSEKERLQKAQKLLGTPLTPQQEEAILKAHYEPVIAHKARILEESGISKKQRRALMESYITGFISPTRSAVINLAAITDQAVLRIAEEMVDSINAGVVDEVALNREVGRIIQLTDNGTIINQPEARNLKITFEALRQESITPRTERRIGGTPSQFEQTIAAIASLEQQIPTLPAGSPARATAEANLLARKNERRSLLELANSPDVLLIDSVKAELIGLFHDARVKVTNKEKEGKEEYEGRGKLQKLAAIQAASRDPYWTFRDPRLLQEARTLFQGETTTFWSSPEIRALEATPAVQTLMVNRGINTLEEGFGGIRDYAYGAGLNMIVEVVKDRHRHRFAADPYPDNGLENIWNGVRIQGMDNVVVDEIGRPLYNEDGEIVTAENFDELREAIETERRMDPYVASRNWETRVEFVADDEEELEEMVPDIAKKTIRMLGTGEPTPTYQGVEDEKKKLDTALAYFKFRSEARRRRVRSNLTDEINGLGGERLSRIARKSVDPYFNYVEFLASACEDTRDRDHLVDSWFLDRNGENLAALELYAGSIPPDELLPADLVNNQEFLEGIRDGGFWRYGRNHVLTNDSLEGTHDMGAMERKQALLEKRFENILMGIRLRSMTDLLNMDDKGSPQGDPKHPAFQRLKIEFDRKDQEDLTRYGHIRDADENPTTQTRWQEYCLKAYVWEKEGKLGDPRTRPRVIFQHPLARAFWPKGFTDENGNIISQRNELWDMYERDPREEKWFFDSKRRRIRQIVGPSSRAERILTNFQMEVTAAGPRIRLRVQRNNQGDLVSPHGDIVWDPNGNPFLAITPALRIPIKLDSTGSPHLIEIEGNTYIEDIVPQFVLIRALSQEALREDQEHVRELNQQGQEGERRRRFKIYHHLKNKLKIPIDAPIFAGWYEGAHDTLRPVLLKYSFDIPGLKQWFNELGSRRAVTLVDGRPDREDGMDAKGTMAGWAEFERRFKLALAYVVRKKYINHYNFPGHQTPRGGNKEMRNANEPARGISGYTVTTTSFIEELISPCGDFGNEFGCTGDGQSPISQLVALFKGGNEAVFGDAGYAGFIVNPRDPESWVKRAKGNFTLMGIYTSGDPNNPGSHGILNDGLLAGVYHLRQYNQLGTHFGAQETAFGYKHPLSAYNELTEKSYEDLVDASARVAAPFMQAIHQFYKGEESNFGRNPESAKFLATYFTNSVFTWMDREWSEYRGVYGFAYDGVLPLARIFMHTVLKESALIYTDQQWDEIMLGYARVEYVDDKGNIIDVERVIRYQIDNDGDTIATKYNDQKKDDEVDGSFSAAKGGNTVKGLVIEGGTKGTKKIGKVEIHEGILDAFPAKLKQEIIARNNNPSQLIKWLPMGIDSHRPETLEVMRNFKSLEGNERIQKIYDVVVKEQFEKLKRPRRKVSRPI